MERQCLSLPLIILSMIRRWNILVLVPPIIGNLLFMALTPMGMACFSSTIWGTASPEKNLTLEDKLKGLQLELIYTIWPDHAVLSRSVRYKNLSDVPVQLQNIFSSALNFPAGDYELQHFYGTWAREFNAARMAVPQGRFIIDSARGTSSAAHSPYIALLEKGTNEVSGCCYGTTLIYSGNFSFQVETGEFEDVTILAGLNPFGFHGTPLSVRKLRRNDLNLRRVQPI